MTRRSWAALAAVAMMAIAASAHADELQSRAERTGFEETSRYADVVHFFGELAKKSPLVRVTSFGKTFDGRDMPLVILADPPVSTPEQAAKSGKPVIFLMANIHAGEVEGKEAVQHLARKIALPEAPPAPNNGGARISRRLLDKIILLIAPIYNADGNERISVQNRTAQYGPAGGVGIRENAQGLDLNRDYMKLESPEARALVRLFSTWDPALTVDLHTTDGSYHGYHLTYSIPLNPATNPAIADFHRDTMMPAISAAMLKRGFRGYYYGNFTGRAALTPQPPLPRTGEGEQRSRRGEGELQDTRRWVAFTHLPRIGQNYLGLRNRLTILSEAYSYLSFARRVEVTEAFCEEILAYSATHAAEIKKLLRDADATTIKEGVGAGAGQPGRFPLAIENRPLAKPVEILVGEVKRVPNPRSGRDWTVAIEDKYTAVRMPDYGTYVATKSVPAAKAYLFRDEPVMVAALEKLQQHGIKIEQLTKGLTSELEAFVIDSVDHAERPFQNHNETKLTGRYERTLVNFPAGSFLVRAGQPLGILAAYLLEPESDDGLATWNFLDASLAPGKPFPVYRALEPVRAPTKPLEAAR